MKISKRSLWLAAVLLVPIIAIAQSTAPSAVPGGFDKATTVITSTQTWLLRASGLIIGIAAIASGIAIAFKKARWEDVSSWVIGAIVVAVAVPLVNWIIN